MCRKPAHYKIFREKIPFTITRTLIPKSPRVHGKFHRIFSFPAFPPLLNHSNTQVFCALKNFFFDFTGKWCKKSSPFQNFSEKISILYQGQS